MLYIIGALISVRPFSRCVFILTISKNIAKTFCMQIHIEWTRTRCQTTGRKKWWPGPFELFIESIEKNFFFIFLIDFLCWSFSEEMPHTGAGWLIPPSPGSGPSLPPGVKVELQNKRLWQQFHAESTEMIITKLGRWVKWKKNVFFFFIIIRITRGTRRVFKDSVGKEKCEDGEMRRRTKVTILRVWSSPRNSFGDNSEPSDLFKLWTWMLSRKVKHENYTESVSVAAEKKWKGLPRERFSIFALALSLWLIPQKSELREGSRARSLLADVHLFSFPYKATLCSSLPRVSDTRRFLFEQSYSSATKSPLNISLALRAPSGTAAVTSFYHTLLKGSWILPLSFMMNWTTKRSL